MDAIERALHGPYGKIVADQLGKLMRHGDAPIIPSDIGPKTVDTECWECRKITRHYAKQSGTRHCFYCGFPVLE